MQTDIIYVTALYKVNNRDGMTENKSYDLGGGWNLSKPWHKQSKYTSLLYGF